MRSIQIEFYNFSTDCVISCDRFEKLPIPVGTIYGIYYPKVDRKREKERNLSKFIYSLSRGSLDVKPSETIFPKDFIPLAA